MEGRAAARPYLLVGRLPKWPTGADCKSAGLRLRWFESITYHQSPLGSYAESEDCRAEAHSAQAGWFKIAMASFRLRLHYGATATTLQAG